jgi:hypothetical protein
MFRYKSGWVVNERGKVMDVYQGKDVENQDIIVYTRHKGLNQQWDIIYKDQWKYYKKGDFHKYFGLYIERDFHIVSRLRSRKYLDLLSNKPVIKTRNGRKTQTWYFHLTSLTIRSKSNNYSWDIISSGRSQEMRVTSTNSQWW